MGLDHDAGNNNSGLELVLGLSLTSTTAEETTTTPPPPSSKPGDHLCLKPTPMKLYSSNFISASNSQAEPSLTLGLSGESYLQQVPKNKMDANKVVYCEDPLELSRQASPHSAVSSFSSGRVVKRERDLSCEEVEVEAAERVSSRVSDEDEDGTNARKKLRLTKEQSALLEESFKQHSTLNPVIIMNLFPLSLYSYISN